MGAPNEPYSEVRRGPGSTFPALVGVAGIACALGMVLGALAPWATTPVIRVSGWSGLGFPLVVVAFLVLVFQALHIFVPNRAWLVISMLLAALTLICAIVLILLISALSRFGDFIALLLTRGDHREAFGAGHPVSLSWGLFVLGASALALMLASTGGLFGRYSSRSGSTGLRRRAGRSPAADASSEVLTASASSEFDPDWLKPQ